MSLCMHSPSLDECILEVCALHCLVGHIGGMRDHLHAKFVYIVLQTFKLCSRYIG